MSAAQDSNLSQNQDQGHLSLDMRQRLQHQQQHLQRSPQTIVQQLPDNNLQAATSKSAYESHMAPSSGHMHHMGSVSAHHATGSHFMADMQNSAERNAFEYLQDLAAELVLCRLVLQSSYVLGYYLQGSSEQHR